MVTVASTAHTMGSVDTADLNFATGGDRKYSPWGAYGQSKAANILFAKVRGALYPSPQPSPQP